MHIVAIYAALLAFIFVVLSARTMRLRRLFRIAVGDSGNPVMLRAIRVQANFAEYVPLALILLYLVEQQGARPLFLHTAGIALVVARLLHAYGVSQTQENLRFRMAGVALTLTVILACASSLLRAALQGIGS